MSSPRYEISPREAAANITISLIDIRPRSERVAMPIFIPGSRSIPLSRLLGEGENALGYSRQTHMALICLSGHRSIEILPSVQRLGYPNVFSLKGGVLAWQAAGLPVAHDVLVRGQQIDIDAFSREVASCFVSEAVENALDRDFSTQFDPAQLFAQLKLRAGIDDVHNGLDACEFLDLVAEMARRLGHDLDHIARNLTEMRRLVAHLEANGQHAVERPR